VGYESEETGRDLGWLVVEVVDRGRKDLQLCSTLQLLTGHSNRLCSSSSTGTLPQPTSAVVILIGLASSLRDLKPTSYMQLQRDDLYAL
jgi:hypothetical protein